MSTWKQIYEASVIYSFSLFSNIWGLFLLYFLKKYRVLCGSSCCCCYCSFVFWLIFSRLGSVATDDDNVYGRVLRVFWVTCVTMKPCVCGLGVLCDNSNNMIAFVLRKQIKTFNRSQINFHTNKILQNNYRTRVSKLSPVESQFCTYRRVLFYLSFNRKKKYIKRTSDQILEFCKHESKFDFFHI